MTSLDLVACGAALGMASVAAGMIRSLFPQRHLFRCAADAVRNHGAG